jgi:hypothetical protein
MFFSMSVNAQMEVQSNGKIAVGKSHSIDNGRLKIGNDGLAQGISFYDSLAGGSDFRIYRTGNTVYLTRGGNHTYGVRMNNMGLVSIGVNPYNSYTSFASRFSVYSQDESTIGSRAYHTYDYGDAVRSQVYRPLSVTYAGWYDDVKTFYVYGNGTVYSNGALITSDVSLKEDIQTITDPLKKVLQLRGVSFKKNFPAENGEAVNQAGNTLEQINGESPHITPEVFDRMQSEKSRRHIGVIAQEVEAVVPELVRTRDDGLKAVAYSEMTGLLIEAIKEQQTRIETLQLEVDELKGGDVSLRSSTEVSGTTGISDPLVAQCKLYPNAPNPFSVETEIRYFLPQGIQQAYICIFDMQGKLLKKVDALTGENTLTVRGAELQAGMYLYSLIAEGKEVDTKKMILTN